jgi:asparagine N-glycosylation enzyme membrane subunit Stt3
MTIRWILGTVFLAAACTAPAQSSKQISVTVVGSTVTVAPSSYTFAKGQHAVTVALGTRGYTITAIQFSSGSGLFNCTPGSGSTTWSCAIGQRDPGASATYTVTVSNGGTPIDSPPAILTQSED